MAVYLQTILQRLSLAGSPLYPTESIRREALVTFYLLFPVCKYLYMFHRPRVCRISLIDSGLDSCIRYWFILLLSMSAISATSIVMFHYYFMPWWAHSCLSCLLKRWVSFCWIWKTWVMNCSKPNIQTKGRMIFIWINPSNNTSWNEVSFLILHSVCWYPLQEGIHSTLAWSICLKLSMVDNLVEFQNRRIA